MATSDLRAVLFDVDGTLVDSNDAHSEAWVRAFAEHDVHVDAKVVRRSIGMGGDKLMPQASGIDEGSVLGERIAARRRAIFTEELLPRLQPFPGAGALVAAVRARGVTTVAASSATREELTRLLEIAGVREAMDGQTSSDDAERSKPDPDIVTAALAVARSEPRQAVMIGDTPYDVEAGTRAGVAVIAFRSGGWSDDELEGALAIYDGPADLLQHLDDSPLFSRDGRQASREQVAQALRVQQVLEGDA
jgi:HAD superfamily hydrolase (TIGR01509 family)